MLLSKIYTDILQDIGSRLGVPPCNAVCQTRYYENGSRIVANKDGDNVMISSTRPNSGYIRFESQWDTEKARGCNVLKYSANFVAIIWEQGGDVVNLLDKANFALAGYKGAGLPYSGISLNLQGFNTAYEQIMGAELGAAQTIPTQSKLAVLRADFTLSFVAPVCDFTAPVCRVFDVAPPPPPPPPTLLQLFLQETEITDPTIIAPLTTFFNTAEGRTYRPKLAAFYPFVGGNANAHKYNLYNPQDTNAAFRLTFSGGWIHTANGITPNGINTFANTHFNEPAHGTVGRGNFGFYSRTNTLSVPQCDIGAFDGVNGSNVFPRFTQVTADRLFLRNQSGGAAFVLGQTQTIRLYQCNRITNPEIRARINGAFVVSTEPFAAQCLRDYYISALNNNNVAQFYSVRQLGCAFIANDGFTDTELIDFENDVNALMVGLGRAV